MQGGVPAKEDIAEKVRRDACADTGTVKIRDGTLCMILEAGVEKRLLSLSRPLPRVLQRSQRQVMPSSIASRLMPRPLSSYNGSTWLFDIERQRLRVNLGNP